MFAGQVFLIYRLKIADSWYNIYIYTNKALKSLVDFVSLK